MQHDQFDQTAAAAPFAAISSLNDPSRDGADHGPIAIEVNNVSKTFSVGGDPSVTFKERLINMGKFSGRAAAEESNLIEKKREVNALHNVHFNVHEGETFGIMGHNGSGKSTLLKIIAGTIRPSEGKIRVRGRMSALLELGAGFHPDLTGRENIYLNASILGFSKEYVENIFDDIVDFSEIGDFIDMQVRYYSSGMSSRLGFAVATNLEPDVLLVDEVLAVGDEAFQLKCMERVHRFRQMNHTMVIVSHGPERIRELCDRAAVLEKGKVLFVGDSNEAIDVYRTALHGSANKPNRKRRRPSSTSKTDDAGPQNQDGHLLLSNAAVEVPPAGEAFAPGEQVRFSVKYEANAACTFLLLIVLRSRNGDVMIRQSSDDILGHRIAVEPGAGELQFAIEDLPLLDDVYSFTFVARDADTREELDRLTGWTEFTVKGPGGPAGRVNATINCLNAAALSGPAVRQPKNGRGRTGGPGRKPQKGTDPTVDLSDRPGKDRKAATAGGNTDRGRRATALKRRSADSP